MDIKNYIYLTTAGEAEARMIQDILKKQRIPSELRPSSTSDALASQAVHGNLPYEVRVPKELLEIARELLNIENPVSTPEEKRSYPRLAVLAAWIFISLVVILAVVFYLLPDF
jgi:hypothetical protein